MIKRLLLSALFLGIACDAFAGNAISVKILNCSGMKDPLSFMSFNQKDTAHMVPYQQIHLKNGQSGMLKCVGPKFCQIHALRRDGSGIPIRIAGDMRNIDSGKLYVAYKQKKSILVSVDTDGTNSCDAYQNK